LRRQRGAGSGGHFVRRTTFVNSDNVVLILETVKQMTQPEIMHLLQRTARIAQEGDEPHKVSLFRLLREMRDPEVKLGMHRALGLLRGLGSTDAVAITEEERR
jgi:uncharacterized protein YjgD (DUF1641 family)